MAKVVAPLGGFEARGKIGNHAVHFPWKGISVVRRWLKPTNPQSAGQGDQRVMLGGTGKACGKVRPNTGNTNVSVFAQQLIDLSLIPNGQTKQSYLVKYIMDNYLTSTTAYGEMISELTNHTVYGAFTAAAGTLGITEFDLAYATVDPYDIGLGLYLIAKAATDLGFTGTPYTLALASWVTASVDAMISDFTNT